MIDTIIFDGEGVVVDTESVWDKGQEEFLRRRGFVYDRAQIKPLLTGRSLIEGVAVLQQEYGFDGDPHEQARERAEIVRELFETEVSFIEGFIDFFESIRDDYKTCIATAMDSALLEPLDRRLGLSELFSNRIYTLNDVARSKPNPDLFLHAAAELESSPAECLVIEDAPHGIEAAHRAGMKCFALATTYSARELGKADAVSPGFSKIELRSLRNGEYRPVYRYTVDNRYGDAICILARAPLAHGCSRFTDETKYWEEEELITAPPADLVEKLAVPGNGGPKDADLQSARVFLRGRFKEVGSPTAPNAFEVATDTKERWMRIDQLPLVKDTLKRLYSKLLVR